MSQLLARKSVAELTAETGDGSGLKRALGKWHLTALGVGAIIGAGIFATTGTAIAGEAGVRPGAGPAIILSFVLTAITCGFAGFATQYRYTPDSAVGVYRLTLAPKSLSIGSAKFTF